MVTKWPGATLKYPLTGGAIPGDAAGRDADQLEYRLLAGGGVAAVMKDDHAAARRQPRFQRRHQRRLLVRAGTPAGGHVREVDDHVRRRAPGQRQQRVVDALAGDLLRRRRQVQPLPVLLIAATMSPGWVSSAAVRPCGFDLVADLEHPQRPMRRQHRCRGAAPRAPDHDDDRQERERDATLRFAGHVGTIPLFRGSVPAPDLRRVELDLEGVQDAILAVDGARSQSTLYGTAIRCSS